MKGGCADLSVAHFRVIPIARCGRFGGYICKLESHRMLDRYVRPMIDPALNRLGHVLAAKGMTADRVTLIGLGIGLVGAGAIVLGWMFTAVILILLSRIADGLDGAVARATHKTDFGGYLDITCDFLFYGAIPMAFVCANPAMNGAAGAFLLTAFYFNGASFLGFAILAEKHGLETKAQGSKSLYYSNGLLEGTETIVFFVLLCLFPTLFPLMAWVFGTLCFATATLRLMGARTVFNTKGPHE